MSEAAIAASRAAIAANPADAAAHCDLGTLLWQAGDYEAALFHLASATAHDPALLAARTNLGSALLALGRIGEAVAEFRAGAAVHPDDADIHYNLGNALMAAEAPAEAEAAYRAALAANPAHAGAHNNLGNALRSRARPDDALAAYHAALALHPDYFGTLNNIGSVLLALHRPDDAEPWLRRAIAANAAYAEAHNNLAGALVALDRPAEAIPHFRRALTLDPTLTQARFGEALALLSLGEFRAGLGAYEARWQEPRFTIDVPEYTTPIWQGEGNIAGRTMLLHAEQGLGDTLHFVRYAALVRARGARVILQVQQPLAELLRAHGDEIVPISNTPRDDPIPEHDLRCPLMSLPHAFGTRRSTIPATIAYITADPSRIAAWRRRLGPATRPRIGIAFSGSPEHPDDALRSIPAATMLAALANTHADLHIVQRDIRATDATTLACHPNTHTHSLANFAETAALLACLDHILTVDTAIAHLAGAMGRPVSILLQHAADFRWMRTLTTTSWYPTARLYRQPTRHDWATPLAAAIAGLPEGKQGSAGQGPEALGTPSR